MLLSPLLALGFWGWEAFFPVAMTSTIGLILCFMGEGLCAQLSVGRITAELVQELVSANEHERELVLASLRKREREWFLAELPRAEAELRRRFWTPHKGAYANAKWSWRLRLAKTEA